MSAHRLPPKTPEDLERQHAGTLAALKEQHKAELSALRKAYERREAELVKRQKEALAAQRAAHKAAMQRLIPYTRTHQLVNEQAVGEVIWREIASIPDDVVVKPADRDRAMQAYHGAVERHMPADAKVVGTYNRQQMNWRTTTDRNNACHTGSGQTLEDCAPAQHNFDQARNLPPSIATRTAQSALNAKSDPVLWSNIASDTNLQRCREYATWLAESNFADMRSADPGLFAAVPVAAKASSKGKGPAAVPHASHLPLPQKHRVPSRNTPSPFSRGSSRRRAGQVSSYLNPSRRASSKHAALQAGQSRSSANFASSVTLTSGPSNRRTLLELPPIPSSLSSSPLTREPLPFDDGQTSINFGSLSGRSYKPSPVNFDLHASSTFSFPPVENLTPGTTWTQTSPEMQPLESSFANVSLGPGNRSRRGSLSGATILPPLPYIRSRTSSFSQSYQGSGSSSGQYNWGLPPFDAPPASTSYGTSRGYH